jgi:hypothetical protein
MHARYSAENLQKGDHLGVISLECSDIKIVVTGLEPD